MSRLYASIDSDARKTQATSRGHKSMSAHVRGWNSGVQVRAYIDENDRDVFEVYRTGGSNGGLAPRLVARIIGDNAEAAERERVMRLYTRRADGTLPADDVKGSEE